MLRVAATNLRCPFLPTPAPLVRVVSGLGQQALTVYLNQTQSSVVDLAACLPQPFYWQSSGEAQEIDTGDHLVTQHLQGVAYFAHKEDPADDLRLLSMGKKADLTTTEDVAADRPC